MKSKLLQACSSTAVTSRLISSPAPRYSSLKTITQACRPLIIIIANVNKRLFQPVSSTSPMADSRSSSLRPLASLLSVKMVQRLVLFLPDFCSCVYHIFHIQHCQLNLAKKHKLTNLVTFFFSCLLSTSKVTAFRHQRIPRSHILTAPPRPAP